MESVEQFFQRSDLSQLRNFLIYGVDNLNASPDPRKYDDRIHEDCEDVFKILEKLSPDEETLQTAITALDKALIAYQEVYATAGLRAGAKLTLQLLKDGEIK